MSVALNIAELIKARFQAAPSGNDLPTTADITGIEVFIRDQKTIENEVLTAVAKKTGAAIVIEWLGYADAVDSARFPRFRNAYKIEAWGRPKLQPGGIPVDEVMESIMQRLWHWVPQGGHVLGEVKLGNGGLVPDRTALIYDLEVTVTVSHSAS